MTDEIARRMAQKGFTKIAYPRSEFDLLTLVYEWRGRRGIANDFEYLAPGLKPRLMPASPIADIPNLTGIWSKERELTIGLSILSGLLSAIGIGGLGLEAGFKNTRKLQYSYSGVRAYALSPTGLDRGLAAFAPPSGGLLSDWLGDNLFVASGILTASKITVKAMNESGQNAKIDIKAIEDLLEVNAGGSVKSTSESTIEFEGDNPVPIGLRLYKIEVGKAGGKEHLKLRTIQQGKVDVHGSDGADELEELPPLDPGIVDATNENSPIPVVFPWDPEANI